MGSVGERAPDRVVVVPRGSQLSTAAWGQLLATLPRCEQERIGGLHRWEDRQDSALGWSCLQDFARDAGTTAGRNRSGRPVAGAGIDVGLSHSGGWIAAATTRSGCVGVDIEAPRPVSPALARRCLADSELAWWEDAPPGRARALRFLQLWTAKEAYLKATGAGLSTDPRDLEIDVTGDRPVLAGDGTGSWEVSAWSPAPDTWLTVCTGSRR
ncbi:MAG: 4'-phosphopantetheinyl transferase superfamily protein [Actinobacteria bacterium]|nr:4'-phosphopantetheinyl transferase superfamily protein [Actinomycetota bacterium]